MFKEKKSRMFNNQFSFYLFHRPFSQKNKKGLVSCDLRKETLIRCPPDPTPPVMPENARWGPSHRFFFFFSEEGVRTEEALFLVRAKNDALFVDTRLFLPHFCEVKQGAGFRRRSGPNWRPWRTWKPSRKAQKTDTEDSGKKIVKHIHTVYLMNILCSWLYYVIFMMLCSLSIRNIGDVYCVIIFQVDSWPRTSSRHLQGLGECFIENGLFVRVRNIMRPQKTWLGSVYHLDHS